MLSIQDEFLYWSSSKKSASSSYFCKVLTPLVDASNITNQGELSLFLQTAEVACNSLMNNEDGYFFPESRMLHLLWIVSKLLLRSLKLFLSAQLSEVYYNYKYKL